MNQTIKVAKLNDTAVLPTRKHANDAGMDLYNNDGDLKVYPNTNLIVHTGVTIELPEGYVGLIWPKSRSIFLIGGGVVDEGYQGEILVRLINPYSIPIIIEQGEAIAQLVIQPVITPEIEEVSLDTIHKKETLRGATGGILEKKEDLPNKTKPEVKPEVRAWNNMKLVRISDVGEKFAQWLYGQTIPLVEGDPTPYDWAYYWDYLRFIRNLPVID